MKRLHKRIERLRVGGGDGELARHGSSYNGWICVGPECLSFANHESRASASEKRLF